MYRLLLLFVLGAGCASAAAQARVSGHIEVKHSEAKASRNNADVIVSLVPVNDSPNLSASPKHFRIAQKDKSFDKHLLAIPAGSIVEFANLDPIFHNVFSLFDGQRFDLGLYEAGSSRSVKFAKPGVSFIFFNIHPQMEAIIVALPTPWFAVTSTNGDFLIPNIPPGRYKLSLWYERTAPEDLTKASRELQVQDDVTITPITIPEMKVLRTQHENKYGRDYDISN